MKGKSILDPYKNTLEEDVKQGAIFIIIEETLRAQGYNGPSE